MKKKILITGASGGFGRLTVEALLKNGHQVVSSMRDIQGRNKDAASTLKNLGSVIVEMDVTNDQSVEAGVKEAIQKLDRKSTRLNSSH